MKQTHVANLNCIITGEVQAAIGCNFISLDEDRSHNQRNNVSAHYHSCYQGKMNKRTIKLWNSLENSIGYKYPEEIKTILNICGFDSELSLKEINESTIKSIEEIINRSVAQNTVEIVSALSKSACKDKPLPFEFLLGHKLLILNIPKTIDSIKENKTRKSVKSLENNLSKELHETENSSENPPSIDELKRSLLLKFAAYAKKSNLKFEIKENHITKFSRTNNVIHCAVQCCFCNVKRSCKFVTHWEISNITQHIRSQHLGQHNLENSRLDNVNDSVTTSGQSTNSTHSAHAIERIGSNVLQEVKASFPKI